MTRTDDVNSITAVIVGRRGSKGFPNKNSRILGGRPMVVHSIDQAREAVCIDHVIVSTDGEEIAAAARSDVLMQEGAREALPPTEGFR